MVRVRYIVKDVAESIEFYTTHLGFEVDQDFSPAEQAYNEFSKGLHLTSGK